VSASSRSYKTAVGKSPFVTSQNKNIPILKYV